MLERLRQNMRDVNRTVKWVMKKTSQVNERDQGKGQLWRSGWYVWEIDGDAETTGIQSQTWKWVNSRKGKFIVWKCLGAEKSLARDGTVRRLVGQVHSELERWWKEIIMERTGWRRDFEIYSMCKGFHARIEMDGEINWKLMMGSISIWEWEPVMNGNKKVS